ncbi:MAG: hypothetical protein U0835_20760 [Isosphaeraceae bacterium]
MKRPKSRRLWVLMVLVLVVGGGLPFLRLKAPEWRDRYQRWRVNSTVYAQLDRVVPMRFPQGVPLEQLLAYVETSTKSPATTSGLKILVDPVGLQEAGRTMTSKVNVDLPNAPLKVSLRASLSQLGLRYVVREGAVCITAKESVDEDL